VGPAVSAAKEASTGQLEVGVVVAVLETDYQRNLRDTCLEDISRESLMSPCILYTPMLQAPARMALSRYGTLNKVR